MKNVSPMRNLMGKDSSTTTNSGTGMLQLNRKKIRELLYGGSASRAGVGNGTALTNFS